MTRFIMVLDDGETYSALDGCSIIAVPSNFDGDVIQEQLDALNRHEEHDLHIVTVFQDGA